MADKIRVINGDGPPEMTLQELTRRQRFMEAFDLDAEYVNVPDGKRGLALLLDGTGDLCLQLGFGPALVAIEQGQKLKVLAGANLKTIHCVFTSLANVHKVRELEGARVGVGSPGALTHQLMTAILLKGGADPAKVEFVNIGNSASVFKAVVNREVDAGLGEIDNVHQQAEFNIHALEDGSLWDQLPMFTNQATYTTEANIAAKRDLIVRVLAASAKLYRYICGPDCKDELLAARRTAVPNGDPKEALAQWSFYQERKPYAVDLVIGEDRLNYMQELNVVMGLQKQVLPFAEVADMSLARDALKLL